MAGIGWFDDIDDADDYFEDERLETDAWDALLESTFAQKTKVLIQAYNRLYYDKEWELPTYAEATDAELIVLKKANGEMAYYLAIHLADEDRRKGLQAQGVTAAGVVKETYSGHLASDNPLDLLKLPIPPIVFHLLEPFRVIKPSFGSVDLVRNEEE